MRISHGPSRPTFLYLSVAAYPPRCDTCLQSVEGVGEGGIASEGVCGLGGILQQVIDHLVVHGNAAEESYTFLLAVVGFVFPYSGIILR